MCIIFDGETKISTGKQQKQGGESASNSNLAGKHIFLAGHPFTLAGQRFCGVVLGGGDDTIRLFVLFEGCVHQNIDLPVKSICIEEQKLALL